MRADGQGAMSAQLTDTVKVDRFTVTSRSRAGLEHEVLLGVHGVDIASCACESFKYGSVMDPPEGRTGQWCYHLQLAYNLQEQQREVHLSQGGRTVRVREPAPGVTVQVGADCSATVTGGTGPAVQVGAGSSVTVEGPAVVDVYGKVDDGEPGPEPHGCDVYCETCRAWYNGGSAHAWPRS